MINDVETLTRCPVCGDRHEGKTARIVCRDKDGAILHSNCKKCMSSSLSILKKGEEGNLLAMGTVTDLDFGETMQHLKESPISIDDLIDVYKLTQNKK